MTHGKKGRKLQKGDTVALLAPSGGIAKIFPRRIERAEEFLNELGYSVRKYPTLSVLDRNGAGEPADRARDLNDAFKDPSIKAIVAAIGGITSNQILEHLDFEMIAENPKIFCGYSDNTILHEALYTKAGLISFYGPCAMTQFAEWPSPSSYTIDSFLQAVSSSDPLGRITPSAEWTEDIVPWGGEDESRARKYVENADGHLWLKQGSARGRITGGCLYSILQVHASPYFGGYENSILCIETPEGMELDRGFPISFVRAQLWDLKVKGILATIAGLVVGRGFGYRPDEVTELHRTLIEVTEGINIPILANVNIGHADPIITLPLRVKALLDSAADRFEILESGVVD